ncbi:MAG: hypothetical protein HRU15_04415 [Planctomycetes bacterium]|nr:hypothetical protein [Planctomycetota bacterium]
MVWKLEDGILPDGVRLDPDGVIRGAASSPEEAEVPIALSDRWEARTQKTLTLNFKAADPEQQGQEKQEQQEQQEKENKDQEQQQEDKQDSSEQEQEGGDQQQQQDSQEGKEGEEQEQSAEEQQQQQAELKAAEEQAEKLNKASAENWLDNLPQESKDALLYQMLKDGIPANDGQDPW